MKGERMNSPLHGALFTLRCTAAVTGYMWRRTQYMGDWAYGGACWLRRYGWQRGDAAVSTCLRRYLSW